MMLAVVAAVAWVAAAPDTSVTVVVLNGTNREMGTEYGQLLSTQLAESLKVLEDHFIKEKGFTEAQVAAQAELFYARFPDTFKDFIEGVGDGSGLGLQAAKILNAMETLGELGQGNGSIAQCAFAYIPPGSTTTGAALVGRNYDFGEPFHVIAKNLVVAVLGGEKGGSNTPVAMLSMPGQIYCPSCVSKTGLFMEMNNGMPSGGSFVNHTANPSLLVDMLTTLQDSKTIDDIGVRMTRPGFHADYSLIVNTASPVTTESFEFSSNRSLGMLSYHPPAGNFVSTNFFQDPAWGQAIPPPTDAATWLGVTRRKHLLNLLSTAEASGNRISPLDLQGIMETPLLSGGALWNMTIYQIIYDSGARTLYMKPRPDPVWTAIPIGTLLDSV